MTDNLTEFKLGDYNHDGTLDLYAIAKHGTSNKTEVHVLDGASNFQTYLAHMATAYGVTDDYTDFELSDYNNDGNLDLYAIAKQGASNTTEVHILDSSSNFQTYLVHATSPLGQSGDNFEFCLGEGKLTIYDIQKMAAVEQQKSTLWDTRVFRHTLSSTQVLPMSLEALLRPVGIAQDLQNMYITIII